MGKNYLINPSFVQKANEIVTSWTTEEKAINYVLLEKELDKIKSIIRDQLIHSGVKDIEFTTWDGTQKKVSIVLGGEKIITTKTKSVDYDKAIKFAQEHNFEIPMTPRIVIEPKIDTTKIECMEWFQQNAEKFVKTVETTKTTKSYDKILIKEVK